MAASILHYGQELSHCFPFLRNAGYSIRRYEKVPDFRQALQSGIDHDAVSLSDLENGESQLIVLAARTYSPAPLILFRTGKVIPFSADDREQAATQDNPQPGFDLVIPAAAPPATWISDIDHLIMRSRQLRIQSTQIRQMSALLRQESREVRAKSRCERERSAFESARNGVTAPDPPIVDRVLRCSICGDEFVFTAGEQLFFRIRKFFSDPRQCKKCMARRQRNHARARSETTVTCAECGISTSVPFKPVRGEPVLCRSCFEKNRKG